MSLFDKRTPAQVVADDVVARLETDFRARVSLNNFLLSRIFNNSGVKKEDILAAFGKQGGDIVTYFKDNASFVNARQADSIPTDRVDGVVKNPDGTVSL